MGDYIHEISGGAMMDYSRDYHTKHVYPAGKRISVFRAYARA